MTQFTCPEVEMHWSFIEGAVDRIVASLDGLTDEQSNWSPPAPETNSISVLAVHTIANVREAIIEILGGQPVGRDRDAEFATVADGSRNLNEEWSTLKAELADSLRSVTCDQLAASYNHPRRGQISGRELLLSTSTHAREHTGHVELTRQLLLASKH